MIFKNPACKNIYFSFNLFEALIYAPKLKSKSFLFNSLSAKNVIEFICICLSYVCSLNKLLYFHIFCSYCKYLTLHINLEMICLSVCLFSFLWLLMLSLNALDTGNLTSHYEILILCYNTHWLLYVLKIVVSGTIF